MERNTRSCFLTKIANTGANKIPNKIECENPRCISRADTSSTKYLLNTSKSGIVPATAPHNIALFPTFLPSTTSPTAAPKTIWVNESI